MSNIPVAPARPFMKHEYNKQRWVVDTTPKPMQPSDRPIYDSAGQVIGYIPAENYSMPLLDMPAVAPTNLVGLTGQSKLSSAVSSARLRRTPGSKAVHIVVKDMPTVHAAAHATGLPAHIVASHVEAPKKKRSPVKKKTPAKKRASSKKSARASY